MDDVALQDTASSQQEVYDAARASYTAELRRRFALPSSQQLAFRHSIYTLFDSACQQLERDHAALIDADRENSRVLNNRQAQAPLLHAHTLVIAFSNSYLLPLINEL